MTDQESIHQLTDNVYKNIIDKFNPEIKQFLAAGRAYQKALHVVSSAAKIYTDCIYKLAQNAHNCKGGTSEIGAGLLQIAEVHKEINTQVLDNIKSFHADLLMPLENKLSNEFKSISLSHKKYTQGHKFFSHTYEKAQSNLKKHRKKSKAKVSYDQKEIQCVRNVAESGAKLDEYRINGLKQAFAEERKRYCLLLERICAMVRNYASHHSEAHELLTHRLQEWTDLSKNPNVMPESTRTLLLSLQPEQLYHIPDDERNSGSRMNGDLHRKGPSSDGGEYGRGPHQRGGHGTPQHGNSQYSSSGAVTLPRSISAAVDLNNPGGVTKMRAIYSHTAGGEHQLSFEEGDYIELIGDKKDGWQFGENIRTGRYGWFPVSFTEALEKSNRSRYPHHRVKSMGNLMDMTNEEETAPLTRSLSIRGRPSSTYDQQNNMQPRAGGMQQQQQQHQQQQRDTTMTSRAPPALPSPPSSLPPPPPPPPLPPSQTHHQQQQRSILSRNNYNHNNRYGQSDPLPPPPPPHNVNFSMQAPITNGFSSSSPSPPASGSSFSNSYNITPPVSTHYGYSGMRPAPPDELPPPPPHLDYHDGYNRNNPFANVQLRKAAVINDRSAPRIY